MKLRRFKPTPFDIAPEAPRYTAAAWRTLVAGLLVLLACAWPLARSLQELQRARGERSRAQSELQAQASAQRAARARLDDPVVVEKIKTQQRLQQMVRMSWFGLFDALETAAQEVRGGVSILSLIPSNTQAEAMQIRLTAVAVNAPLMLEYLRVLKKDPRIIAVELSSQQADDNAAPGVIRMQLNISWNPQALAPPPTMPTEKPKDQGLVAATSVAREPVAKVMVNRGTP